MACVYSKGMQCIFLDMQLKHQAKQISQKILQSEGICLVTYPFNRLMSLGKFLEPETPKLLR